VLAGECLPQLRSQTTDVGPEGFVATSHLPYGNARLFGKTDPPLASRA
jgi:hypothetical protein